MVALMRAGSEILAEMALLKAHGTRLVEDVEQVDLEGALAAQIQVLQERLSESSVLETWGPGESTDNPRWFVAKSAMVASRWLHFGQGRHPRRPSESWGPYLIERRRDEYRQGSVERRVATRLT